MSNPKHSPLPWATDGQELRDAKGELIGMTYSDGNNLRDAEFIVRAANAHGALVSALETAEEYLYSEVPLDGWGRLDNGSNADRKAALVAIGEALALAKGVSK